MNLPLLTVLVFVVTLTLVIVGMYFLIIAPASKRRLRARLATAQELDVLHVTTAEGQVLRQEVLSKVPFFNQLLVQIPGTAQLNLFIQQSAVDVSTGMLIFISLLLAWFTFLISLLAHFPLLLAALIGMLFGAIPYMVIAVKRQRRFLRFEELFPDAIDLLSRAVRAGHAFTTGLDLIAKEMPQPVSEEFRRLYEQQNLGLPIRDAFMNLATRVPLPDVRIFVTALTIQRETGGNLAEILDNLSYVMRERFKLYRQIKVFTAQGRLTMYLLVSTPPAAGLMFFTLNRDYMMPLFKDPLGLKILTVALVLQVMGYFVIRKIIQPKF